MSSIWPEYGIGLILNEKEIKNLIEEIKKIEDVDVVDSYDIDNLNIFPPIVVIDNIIWEHIADINGRVISQKIYDEIIGNSTGCIITAKKKMSPFAAAYKNTKELVDEMKETVGKYLPENFNYENHLVTYHFVIEE